MDSLWIEISLQPSLTWRHVPVDLQEPASNQNIHEYISVRNTRRREQNQIDI
jgi:hypothetical protein